MKRYFTLKNVLIAVGVYWLACKLLHKKDVAAQPSLSEKAPLNTLAADQIKKAATSTFSASIIKRIFQ
jgi:hypothetical protein